MTNSTAVLSKDYRRQYEMIWPEVRAAIERAIFEDDPILGTAVERFEEKLARCHEVEFAVGFGSGTDAIIAMLRELCGAPGGEIITGAHTFSGVVSAIVLAGFVPVLADVDERTGMIDPARAEAAIGPQTRAILGVHLYGRPVEVDELRELARACGVLFLEDGAQAHGATWRGRPIGGFGAACALSFHPSKNLGAFGDGGAVLTRDRFLAERLRVARNLGKCGKYEFVDISGNSKLDTVQAAILEVKLAHLAAWVERRRTLAARYAEGLAGIGDLILPEDGANARHAFHLYVVRTERREELRRHLASRDIRAGLHYPIAAHRQPALADRFRGSSFPIAERLAATVLTLPLSHEHTDGELDRVIEEVRRFYGTAR